MTKSTFFVEEDKILATLFEEGLDNLHLYKPDTSPIYSERLLSLLPEETYNKITVHSHFYLKEEYRLAGIHLDSTSEPIPVGYKGKISRTCSDLTELKEMKKQSAYVFLGNIFQSQSDPAAPTLNINELEYAAERGLIDKKVLPSEASMLITYSSSESWDSEVSSSATTYGASSTYITRWTIKSL